MIREKFAGDLRQAIKAQDAHRAATLRLVCAALRDREIARRSEDLQSGLSDAEVLAVLARMVRQREESLRAYQEAGRFDLADAERAEIGILEGYLPKPMSESEVQRAIDTAIADTGAASIRDIAKVMAHLKSHHSGRMDFARVCLAVKQSFG